MNVAPAKLLSFRLVASLVAGLGLGLVGPSPASAEPAENLARELSRLRAETEALSERIGSELEDRRVRLRGLAEQKTSAEGERRREEQRRVELAARRDKLKATIAEAATREEALVPAVKTLIAAVRATIDSGLPYRRVERLEALDGLLRDLEERKSTPSQVFGRLWESIEDELRLGREVALDRQVVPLPDGERLVDVLRIGMALLYFRTSDGRVGQATWRGRWAFEYLGAQSEIEKLGAAFAAFDKRVSSGFFALPLLEGGLR